MLAGTPQLALPAPPHDTGNRIRIYYGMIVSKSLVRSVLVFLLLLLHPWQHQAAAYSLLTHEQLIDLTWDRSIVPLLLSRYPNLTQADLDQARAYAYGGCVIQDIGYYPFGDPFFSDLTHYVRTGDFIVSLLRNATNANEMAFAVGALSHYIGDSVGHALATNRAVPVEFPDLAAKYGSSVNYAEGKHQHVRTEFAFDISEIARHHMAPVHYLRHIGLQVPLKQLALAFYQTYGITEDFSQRRGRRFNVRGYRFATRYFIPRIAYAVTLLHRRHMVPAPSTPEGLELEREIATISQENNWDAYRRHAGIGTWTLAGFLFILPKFGPLSLVAIKGPTEATDAEYVHSVAVSSAALRRMLARFTPEAKRLASLEGVSLEKQSSAPMAQAATKQMPGLESPSDDDKFRSTDPHHPLPDRDLDTGRVVQPGGYSLTDFTYANLLHRLTRQPTQPIPPVIKREIEAYYADPNLPITTKKDPDKWKQVQADLAVLQSMPTSTEPEPYPTYGDEAENAQ